jgi:hypothetical protein
MNLGSIPAKFPIPWANAAGGGFVRTIPVASQIGVSDGAASLTDGYPPLNFQPIGAGGVPPFGQDMNGILKQITQWLQWTQAGGGVPYFDGAFAAAIGGYPQGAFLQSATTPGTFWISTADANVNNPDSTPTNWLSFPGTSIIPPARIVTASATLNLNADTDYAIGLNRTSTPSAMVVNLAATGTLKVGQPFEIWDLVGNCDLFPVTVTPPASHTIAGRTTFVMNQQGQSCMFKYLGVSGGINLWGVK